MATELATLCNLILFGKGIRIRNPDRTSLVSKLEILFLRKRLKIGHFGCTVRESASFKY